MNTDPNANRSVYCCYLLRCLNPKWNNSQYIGFTNNPPKRIRQHNGLVIGGAKKTKSKRPWEMVVFIYGFPTKHSALQFEWAWQNPKNSRLIKHNLTKKRYKSGVLGKIQILFEMIHILPFINYSLSINWTNQIHFNGYYTNNIIIILKPASHVKMYIRDLLILNYFAKSTKMIKTNNNNTNNNTNNSDILNIFHKHLNNKYPSTIYCHSCGNITDISHLKDLNQTSLLLQYDNIFTKCPNKQCNVFHHLLCLTKNTLNKAIKQYNNNDNSNDNDNKKGISNKLTIIPKNVRCTNCRNTYCWPEYIRNTLRFFDITIDDVDEYDEDEDEYEDDVDDEDIDMTTTCNKSNDDANLRKKLILKDLDDDDDDDMDTDTDGYVGMSLRDRLKRRHNK